MNLLSLNKRLTTLIMTLCLSLAVVKASAEEDHDPLNTSAHPHHLSLFLGNTKLDDESGFTIGVDYEYRLNAFVGLGSVIEYSAGDLDAWTVLAVTDLHITNQWIAQLGPGAEFTSEHELFVFRVGTLYEFEVADWTISPQVHFDYHDGHDNATVVGLAIGHAF